ncbi:MAG: diphosphomevalonate decarboxylase [Bacteroidetes bacterium HGW-Bacteroidetes-17]|nr:MAG: diphosphomevalonate decarboxylase [Bacteroidetes bacterium HGW-Bacteroidetes-17]
MDHLTKTENSVKWQSPSNIAIVKYWGKKGIQIPMNPSISFSLSNAVTETEIVYTPKQNTEEVSLDFYFNGTRNHAFEDRFLKYLTQIKSEFKLLTQFHLSINSKNTFPHSAGIASSASSMSSMVLCLLSIEHKEKQLSKDAFLKKASYLSRLASGSACRSVYPGFSLWGKTSVLHSSSDEYAVPLSEIHPVFNDLQDSILIVNSKQKKISSSAGHLLMELHPFKEARIEQANQHATQLIKALKLGDFASFIRLCETEALSLHAMMMTSNPSYVLMEANSLKIIEKIRQFRNDSGFDLCFTLDAGPNIHLLYPKLIKEEIIKFIKAELLVYCESDNWIVDEMGNGPKKLDKQFYER